MQNREAERLFYTARFGRNPRTEHIAYGYDELHGLAFESVPCGRVLDVGCGTGAHTLRLAARGYDVIAVDLLPLAVRAARDRLRDAGLNASFVVADATALPLRDRAVSVTWSALLLHHFPVPSAACRELARVTADCVVIFEPNAQNPATLLAFNVVNRFVGFSGMTPNQRALWPWRVAHHFRRHGLETERRYFVDRQWPDRHGGWRRVYAMLTQWLPKPIRGNKFLMILRRTAA